MNGIRRSTRKSWPSDSSKNSIKAMNEIPADRARPSVKLRDCSSSGSEERVERINDNKTSKNRTASKRKGIAINRPPGKNHPFFGRGLTSTMPSFSIR